MRRSPLAAALVALACCASLAVPAAAPLSAHEDEAPARTAPLPVPVSPDQLLAPYYESLRQRVSLPEAGPNPALAPSLALTRIAFGSCNHQSAPQDYWAAIAAEAPQLFLMIGDNVYGDNAWDGDAGLESLRAAYALQASHPEFRAFRARIPMLATWDDHDFGLNDAGASFPMRRWAETLFEHFWNASDAVRARPGVYDSIITGPEGRRVQVILLDTRFFRSDLKRARARSGAHRPVLPDGELRACRYRLEGAAPDADAEGQRQRHAHQPELCLVSALAPSRERRRCLPAARHRA